jgi:3-isopropylmalate/(R)-2-methylmalate dehydratase large subunit
MSGKTIAEKVLARAAGRDRVEAGEIVDARVDRICVNEQFERLHRSLVEAGFPGGLPRIARPERVHLLVDHYQPALNATQARRQDKLRALVRHYGLENFTDTVCGVIHRIVMETVVQPGELGLCNDSHGTAWGAVNSLGTGLGEHDIAYALVFGELWFKVPQTARVELTGALPDGLSAKDVMLRLAALKGDDFGLYRALEFTGTGAAALSIDQRTALCSHAVELGAKFGVFPFDTATDAFFRKWRGPGADLSGMAVAADPDARYAETVQMDLSALEPQVARPARFGAVADLSEVAGQKVTQAVIGSCANGMFHDIADAARILAGRRVAPGVRFFIQPASWGVYREVVAAGLFEPLLDAGAQVLQPGCHLCQGRQGYLSAEDVCVTSTTRNHRGRMGEPAADVWLAGAGVVAASAVAGHLTDPREYL